MEHGVIRSKDCHLGLFVSHLLWIAAHHVGVGPIVVVELGRVVLHDGHASVLHVVKQASVVRDQVRPHRVSAHTKHDRFVAREISDSEILCGKVAD